MNAQERFWQWFVQHDAELFDFEDDLERIFDDLAAELRKVDENLTFEFGPKLNSCVPDLTSREIVISAGGIKSAFPAVLSLVKSAPALDRWRVTAFRPRRSPISTVRINGNEVNPKTVSFTLLDNGKTAGIHLFVPGFVEADSSWKSMAYLILDEALGEYDVETRLGLIKMFAPEEKTTAQRHPLEELPVLFDKLVARLEGRSGKPS